MRLGDGTRAVLFSGSGGDGVHVHACKAFIGDEVFLFKDAPIRYSESGPVLVSIAAPPSRHIRVDMVFSLILINLSFMWRNNKNPIISRVCGIFNPDQMLIPLRHHFSMSSMYRHLKKKKGLC